MVKKMTSPNDRETLSSDVVEVRLQKLDQMRRLGVNPYPTHFHRTATNAEVAQRFAHLAADTGSDEKVVVAGRVFASRNNSMFIDLHDATGKLQIFSHEKVTETESLAVLPLIEVGDIIGVEGTVRRTARGEITVDARVLHVLCKTIRPIPDTYHGIADVELRYRRRYLDIMVEPESRTRFRQRSAILAGVRSFMQQEGFLEVETPMLQPIYGGATAQPFVTHHNTLDMNLYLRIAPELNLKRLLISGLSDKVFEVNRNFRNEGVSTRHNPEFTMMEAYWAYADYVDVMGLIERLFSGLAVVRNLIRVDIPMILRGKVIKFLPLRVPSLRVGIAGGIECYRIVQIGKNTVVKIELPFRHVAQRGDFEGSAEAGVFGLRGGAFRSA